MTRERFVDEMIDAYAQWREECVAVTLFYDRWTNASREDELVAFGAYEAALDSEERASRVYADLVQRVGDLVRGCSARSRCSSSPAIFALVRRGELTDAVANTVLRGPQPAVVGAN